MAHYSMLKFAYTGEKGHWDGTGELFDIEPINCQRYIDLERDTLDISDEFLESFHERGGWVDLSPVENIAVCAVKAIPTTTPDDAEWEDDDVSKTIFPS